MNMFRILVLFGEIRPGLRWFIQRRRGLSWETIAVDDDQENAQEVVLHLNRLAARLCG
jgi:hypothetical protein